MDSQQHSNSVQHVAVFSRKVALPTMPPRPSNGVETTLLASERRGMPVTVKICVTAKKFKFKKINSRFKEIKCNFKHNPVSRRQHRFRRNFKKIKSNF